MIYNVPVTTHRCSGRCCFSLSSLQDQAALLLQHERDIAPLECPLVVRWVIGSIPHDGPIELFHRCIVHTDLVPASSPRLVNKSRSLCYHVCGMVHIKEPLLLIRKSSPCGSWFPLSFSEWSFTICPMPYNRK